MCAHSSMIVLSASVSVRASAPQETAVMLSMLLMLFNCVELSM